MKSNSKTALTCLLASLAFIANATEEKDSDQPAVDKSAFHLFNPTPKEHLRILTVDGPGATESPYTVDAGHFQIEMSLVDYTRENDTFDGVKFKLDWLAVAPMNLKVGLLNSLDLQLVLEPANRIEQSETGSPKVIEHGYGDTTVRLKYNVWGNDEGRTALALTPFVRFPTSQFDLGIDNVEYGVIVPFEMELPGEFSLGLTARFVSAQDILGGDGQHAEFGNSIELGREIVADLEGYVEFYSNVSTERDVDWVGRVGAGLLYWIGDDVFLNGGVNVGVTKWADNWNFFLGFAWRY